jgi:nitrite reductase (NO-forming)
MQHIESRLFLSGAAVIGLLVFAACGDGEPTPAPAPTGTASTATPNGAGQAADDPDVAFRLLPIIHIGAFIDPADTTGREPNPTLRVPLGGVVKVTLENHGDGEFDIYFPNFDAKSEPVSGGSSTSLVFVADKEGEFPYYSTVPGHREAGLEGRIVVTAAE